MTAALVVIVMMFVAAFWTMIRFTMIRKVAGMLLLPYLGWLIFAGFLNYEIMRLNPNAEAPSPDAGAAEIKL